MQDKETTPGMQCDYRHVSWGSQHLSAIKHERGLFQAATIFHVHRSHAQSMAGQGVHVNYLQSEEKEAPRFFVVLGAMYIADILAILHQTKHGLASRSLACAFHCDIHLSLLLQLVRSMW